MLSQDITKVSAQVYQLCCVTGHHKGQRTSSSVGLCHWTSQRSVHRIISCVMSLNITTVSGQVYWLSCLTDTVHYHNGQCTSISVVLLDITQSVHKFISCVASLDITSVFVTGHHKFIGYIMPWFDW